MSKLVFLHSSWANTRDGLLIFMFFDYIIIKYNYDMYMLRNYATEHWQSAGGEQKNRHAILQLCSNKTSALAAVVLRRPRLPPLYSDVRAYRRKRDHKKI